MLSNHRSELNSSKASFKGTHPLRGVNPANGVVIYFKLPELTDKENIELEIQDQSGNLINKFSSEEDKGFKKYDGGPPKPAKLPKQTGLNRFVWNMRHQDMPGIPKAYIEGSYRGHKVSPGQYKMVLKLGEKQCESTFTIEANPLYPTTAKDYADYDETMIEMEQTLSEMHRLTNRLHKKQTQIKKLLDSLPEKKSLADLKEDGKTLLEKLKSWDEEMVQRKSKAYDDVENFPNKFTAEYLFLINQTESDIPRVTQGSKDRRSELESQWADLKKQAKSLNSEIKKFNQQLWAKKIGAIWDGE